MKKEKTSQIGVVRLDGKFVTRNTRQKHLYPADGLIKFLNLDTTSEEAIQQFCSKYKFVPRNWQPSFFDGFREEYARILCIIEHAQKNILSDEDILLINEELQAVCPKLITTTEAKLNNINNERANEEQGEGVYGLNKEKEKHFALIYTHKNSIVSLWLEVAQFILLRDEIRLCPTCGTYFKRSKFSKSQRYCSEICKDRQKKITKKRKVA